MSTEKKYYLKKEIAAMYCISVRMLRHEVLTGKIFDKEYYTKRKLLSPADVEKIFFKLGIPE